MIFDDLSGPTAARLEAWLVEDAPYGDPTTELLAITDVPGRITFAARSGMVLVGVEEAAAPLERTSASPAPARAFRAPRRSASTPCGPARP